MSDVRENLTYELFYTGVGTTLEMPVMLAPVPIDFSDKKVLITDDVADTGKSLKLVHDFCVDAVAEVRSAVIYEARARSCPIVINASRTCPA